MKCQCFHALDGYETYKIDDNTIGVRPFWISVKDRLPDDNQNVLAICITEKEKIYNCRADGWFRDTIYSCRMGNFGKKEFIIQSHGPTFPATHWMPLPQPPKE